MPCRCPCPCSSPLLPKLGGVLCRGEPLCWLSQPWAKQREIKPAAHPLGRRTHHSTPPGLNPSLPKLWKPATKCNTEDSSNTPSHCLQPGRCGLEPKLGFSIPRGKYLGAEQTQSCQQEPSWGTKGQAAPPARPLRSPLRPDGAASLEALVLGGLPKPEDGHSRGERRRKAPGRLLLHLKGNPATEDLSVRTFTLLQFSPGSISFPRASVASSPNTQARRFALDKLLVQKIPLQNHQ